MDAVCIKPTATASSSRPEEMPKERVWQHVGLDNKTSSLTQGELAHTGDGIRFCTGQCNEICCQIMRDLEQAKLYFIGNWTEEEQAVLRGELLGGQFPADFREYWHSIGLQYRAKVEYISPVYPEKIIDLSGSNRQTAQELMATLPAGFETEIYFGYDTSFSCKHDYLNGRVNDGESVRFVMRKGEYEVDPVISVVMDRDETTNLGWFRGERTETVWYWLGDLHKSLSRELIRSEIDIKSLTGHWINRHQIVQNDKVFLKAAAKD